MMFTTQIRSILLSVQTLESKSRLIADFASDTRHGESTADWDLLNAARSAEEFASTCRRLHARIEQARADLNNPVLIAAE